MVQFVSGQRWISEMEPELGLGIVGEVKGRTVMILYPASNVRRQYAAKTAPLRRVKFQEGNRISSQDGIHIRIESVSVKDGLRTYHGNGQDIIESALSDVISFSTPEDRLTKGYFDQTELFDLRYDTILHQHQHQKSNVRGFIGGRIDIIPHQFYIAHEVCSRQILRVLLADEVGLGKTIEACLIIHRLLSSGKINRVLILVPPSLVHQWLIELLQRFSLIFRIADEPYYKAIEQNDATINPFLEDQLVLADIDYLSKNHKRSRQAVDAGWDILVVDEAHHLEEGGDRFSLVDALGKSVEKVLLLTATPEQIGLQNHFSRLRILDPHRYHDFANFNSEIKNYSFTAGIIDKLFHHKALSDVEIDSFFKQFPTTSERLKAGLKESAHEEDGNRKELIEHLLDQHGIGRVMFRNTRKNIKGFPARRAHLSKIPEAQNQKHILRGISQEYALKPSKKKAQSCDSTTLLPHVIWLADLLRDHKDEKFLLICRSKEKALAIDNTLRPVIPIKTALFHEDLSLIQRDRNAAWFSEKKGAQLLICSEIGSEGRNFQFAHHLVFFDLPFDPELLEQRIGRLDRIGQKQTIHIHIPIIEGSAQEVLARWYHEGLDAFEKQLPAGNKFLSVLGDRVAELATGFHESDRKDDLKALLRDSRDYRKKIIRQIEQGRDRLLEQSSFRPAVAENLVRTMNKIDKDLSLDHLIMRLWVYFGIEASERDPRTYSLSAGHRFNDAFPNFSEQMLVTFSRKEAMIRQNIRLLTWDHPMVVGAMQLLTGSEKGNCALAFWEDRKDSTLLLEALFVLEAVAPLNLHLDRFLPPTPVRIVVNHQGHNCTELYPHDRLSAELKNGFPDLLAGQGDNLKRLINQMTKTVHNFSKKEFLHIVGVSLKEMFEKTGREINRLCDLKAINPNIKEEEIEISRKEQQALEKYINAARPRLDAIRLIWKGPAA